MFPRARSVTPHDYNMGAPTKTASRKRHTKEPVSEKARVNPEPDVDLVLTRVDLSLVWTVGISVHLGWFIDDTSTPVGTKLGNHIAPG